jgi:hypothetical protein
MYLSRRVNEKGRYSYLVECSVCNGQRWQSHAKASRCHSCAGKLTYTPATIERKDARQVGEGYITKQGYHLVFKNGAYVPAQRLPFPDLPTDWVVHHVDGNKLHNERPNLHPCTKGEHREIHAQLEKLSYFLVQQGLIDFVDAKYAFSTSMKEFMLANSVNSGKPVSIDIDGNPEPSLVQPGRCNDYPVREYSQVAGSAEHPTSDS